MITCNLMGGLGNQIFQIFATISYAIKSRNQFKFLNVSSLGGGSTTIRNTFWNSFFSKLKPFLVDNISQPIHIIREKDFTFNEFNTKLYEYTTYKRYWSKRIKDELKYINTHPNKTIGDLTSFENRKKEIIESMEKMSIINSQMRECDDNNNFIITYDNFTVEIADVYIKENRRIKE